MATAVFFHAHPDDESIATGGSMVLAAAAGHRVVLVCATDGAVGEPTEGSVPDGSTLADVRLAELEESGRILGASRVEWLGYGDSGMDGESTNDHEHCFWQADVEEAAARLAAILRDEEADILTVYDANGGYGHPDHVQVHRVGVRAAALAGTPRVYEATMNRDRMRALADVAFAEEDLTDPELAAQREEMRETDMGTPEAEITHEIDVQAVAETKRRSMAAHRSQIDEESFFLAMPHDAFLAAFGHEYYIERGADRSGPPFATDLFAPDSRITTSHSGGDPRETRPMSQVIKINAITVPADLGDEVARRFAERAGAVDGMDGFEGFELMRPTDDRETWLVVTRWRDEESFSAWTQSQQFRDGHREALAAGKDAPAPLPISAELWSYEVELDRDGE